jgi:hypothetical protein
MSESRRSYQKCSCTRLSAGSDSALALRLRCLASSAWAAPSRSRWASTQAGINWIGITRGGPTSSPNTNCRVATTSKPHNCCFSSFAAVSPSYKEHAAAACSRRVEPAATRPASHFDVARATRTPDNNYGQPTGRGDCAQKQGQ